MHKLVKRIEDGLDDLRKSTEKQLLAGYAKGVALTLEGYLNAARNLLILEEKFEDKDFSHLPLYREIKRIAEGMLLPEVMIRYQLAHQVRHAVEQLPISEQARLVGDQPAVLVLHEINGDWQERRVDPLELSPLQIRQVFHRGAIRTAAEQRSWLEELRERHRTKAEVREKIAEGLEVNRRKKMFYYGGVEIPFAILAQMNAIAASM